MVADGQFRNDLYYRLSVFPIVLPPLRDRADDIPRLVRHLTQKFARRIGRRIETISTEVMDALVRYRWPGNIRELENVIERAVILSPGPVLQVPLGELAVEGTKPDLRSHESELKSRRSFSDDSAPTSAITLAEAEREHILGALRATGWVVQGAAARLGMKRSTLRWKMQRLGISRPQ
jgi:formate hydrogenlyase transcriptional activator